MKLVLVNPYLGPVPGGIEYDLVHLAQEFVHSGDQVAIVTTPYEFPDGEANLAMPPVYNLDSRVMVTRLRGVLRSRLRDFQPANAPLWLPRLVRTAMRDEPDAVIFFNVGWPLTVLPALLALRRQTVVLYRTAYHTHDVRHPLDPVRQRLQLGVAALSHRLLPYSHFEKQQIVRDGAIQESKITPVYPGMAVPGVTAAEIAAFRKCHELSGKGVIAHVARLSAFKGTDKLIRVLPEVRRQTGLDVVLLLVGRNLEADSLGRLARELDVMEQVRFTGPLSEYDLHRAYAASDVFALPSRYESFGFVFLEAMAHGIPVIGVRTGGVPEVILDGKTGFVLDSPNDLQGLTNRLVRMLSDERVRSRFGEAARAWTERQFNWGKTVREVRKIIRELQP